MDEIGFAEIVSRCAARVIAGADIEDVLTDPRGPASAAVGTYALDTIYAAVVLALSARRYNLLGARQQQQTN